MGRRKEFKVHQCHICKKVFKRKYNVTLHLRVHSDERPYKCEYDGCREAFRWNSSLISHMASHKRGAPVQEDPRTEREGSPSIETSSNVTSLDIRNQDISDDFEGCRSPCSEKSDLLSSSIDNSEVSMIYDPMFFTPVVF